MQLGSLAPLLVLAALIAAAHSFALSAGAALRSVARTAGPSAALRMAASGPRGGGGGATKLDTRTKTRTSLKEEIEKDWRLIVHDDNIHTIQQVCEIISRCCPL